MGRRKNKHPIWNGKALRHDVRYAIENNWRKIFPDSDHVPFAEIVNILEKEMESLKKNIVDERRRNALLEIEKTMKGYTGGQVRSVHIINRGCSF